MNQPVYVSNGTVLGHWPLGKSIVIVGGLLVAIFVLMEPEASQGLGFIPRTLFWTTNVGLALAAVYAASWFQLSIFARRVSPWLALLTSAVAGAALMAPFGYLAEQLLPEVWRPTDDGDWLDVFERQGIWQGIVAEFFEEGPQVLVIWLAINLPLLKAKVEYDDTQGSRVDGNPRGDVEVVKDEAGRYAEEVRNEFLNDIPDALGTNILAISSDLHYLHIYTELGHSMISGSLQRAADALGEDGMRVHRAHWVARSAIVKIVKDRQQWYCLLTNDLKIPISRRKKSVVAGWFGHSTKILPIARSQRDIAG